MTGVSIKVDKVIKSYGAVKAVNELSFEVEKGQLFGLIGPDGAGKTTLFKILTTLLIPDHGDAWVEGLHTVKDFKKLRKIIGYMPGQFSLYRDLTVEENLTFFATIFGTSIKENYHLVADIYTQLEPFRKRKAQNLSGGMKQKLALCCALIHEPKVLFLDEPTTGVDAVSRAEFWEMLKRLKDRGITILVSTPYMDEASLCEMVALIQNGSIFSIDTPQSIISNYRKDIFSVRSHSFYRLLLDLRGLQFTERAEVFGQYIHLTTKGNISEKQILDTVISMGHQNVETFRTIPTIEDVFLDLMNKVAQ